MLGVKCRVGNTCFSHLLRVILLENLWEGHYDCPGLRLALGRTGVAAFIFSKGMKFWQLFQKYEECLQKMQIFGLNQNPWSEVTRSVGSWKCVWDWRPRHLPF